MNKKKQSKTPCAQKTKTVNSSPVPLARFGTKLVSQSTKSTFDTLIRALGFNQEKVEDDLLDMLYSRITHEISLRVSVNGKEEEVLLTDEEASLYLKAEDDALRKMQTDFFSLENLEAAEGEK